MHGNGEVRGHDGGDEALARPVAGVTAAAAGEPGDVWAYGGRRVGIYIVPMAREEVQRVPRRRRIGAELREERVGEIVFGVDIGLEVVCRVVGKGDQIARRGPFRAVRKERGGGAAAGPEDLLADGRRAADERADLLRIDHIHVQGHDFQVELGHVAEIARIGHIPAAEICADLGALLRVCVAGARVRAAVVVVPVDGESGQVHEFAVDAQPLFGPLGVLRVCDAGRVERVSDINHKLHVPNRGRVGAHLPRHGALAPRSQRRCL
ncbi:hypothetical protein M885DRAFT_506230 [Pelagophyceae sp. CCMP2097]|nr:hypothetical protein M885DRAFT_506230 [Pelagophyceae sp. CCMP2097]